MAISVSSDSSEDSVGTPGRVILFGYIPTIVLDTTPVITPPTTQTDTTMIPTETPIITPTIPPSPDYTPASPDYSPTSKRESDPSEDPSSDHIPPLPATLPFLSSDDDTTDTPGQPIPHGRPYRYHPNGPVHMMTARKRVRPLPIQKLDVRHSVDHSSSDYFSPDDLARDSSLDSSSEASSDFHLDASSDSSSRYSLSDHSSPVLPNEAISQETDSGYLAYVEFGLRETRVERVTQPAIPEDIPKPAQEGAVEVIKGVQREQGHRIVGVESAITALIERVVELERDNRRLRGTASVESQRVDRLQRGMKMPNTRSEASMTHEEIVDLVTRRVAKEIEAIEAAMNLERPNENDDEQENGNRGNGGNGNGGNEGNGNRGNGGNGENRNGDRNGDHVMNYGGFIPMARECTFQDFLKCKPHTFSGTKGVVGLTRWFEKMETVFNISNCPPKYQVKYATCTLHDSALTWWNSHKRTISVDAAYAMKWAGLMKLMTEELILLCTRMVPDKEDIVERFIGGLPDNIQGNLQGYAARSTGSKRRMESNSRDNYGQQPPFKRQNTSGQNVARAYTTENNERKGYVGSFPYCNKCRLHHKGLCTIRCRNCKKIGHQTRDCRVTVTPNTQGAAVGNQQGNVCYECGRPGHFRKDCPKLRSMQDLWKLNVF
uniref:CCHC-type domain-containing protein n=1 Tax=Tanacetum cinerariifolium TaxID=118510 RepID=A0A699HNP9_TANCI|nr:hypothetical protein [Tanacetum cinerariifolium]